MEKLPSSFINELSEQEIIKLLQNMTDSRKLASNAITPLLDTISYYDKYNNILSTRLQELKNNKL